MRLKVTFLIFVGGVKVALSTQCFLWNKIFRKSEVVTDQSPFNWYLKYLSLDMFREPLLFYQTLGNQGTSSGNLMVPTGGTPKLDWLSMLTMNLWYSSVINYKLMASSNVHMVSTPVVVGSMGDVRLEGESKIFDLTFMEIAF
ncbi:unnamed protein product [Vicia faba]|uniref:Uncharacterized protein n=1 Tax=Vicia faba TaxID=3906 RepID=A0AAV0YEW8_VICFA|nr:unnamed protein product [Vicia faba]